MNWKVLNDYRCPKCCGHLRLLKTRKLFICETDGFAITQKRREQLAKKWPIRVDPKIEAHFIGITMMA